LVLACTHYPLLINKIKKFIPSGVSIVSQGEIVSKSLVDYLARHPEIDSKCKKTGHREFYTTDSVESFNRLASLFYEQEISAGKVNIG